MFFARLSGILVFSTPVFANLEKIKAGIINLANQTHVFDHSEYLHLSRSLDGVIELTNLLDKYGCWCYFGDGMIGKGRGNPVDFIDEVCKQLADGYACGKIDSGDNDCVPWEADYIEGYMAEDIVAECHGINQHGSCSAYACVAEGVFMVEIVNAYFGSLGKIDMGNRRGENFKKNFEKIIYNVIFYLVPQSLRRI